MSIPDDIILRIREILNQHDEAESIAAKNEASNTTFIDKWIETTAAPLFADLSNYFRSGGRELLVGFGGKRPEKPKDLGPPPGAKVPAQDFSHFSVVILRDGKP